MSEVIQRREPTPRAFRPMRFEQVIGQSSVVTILKNALESGTFAHAYLFCGPRGTGKTTLARLIARSLVCPNKKGAEPCGACPVCIDAASSRALDVIEIDGASNRGIDEIRKINETVAYSPSHGAYKIYIIDEVHMLTKEAFNALLKTLEEPPAHVVFLFATTEPQKIPATILSRCQRLQLERLSTNEIASALTNIALQLEIKADPEALRLIARAAEGSLRDAQSLFDQATAFTTPITVASARQALGIPAHDHLFALDEAARQGSIAAAYTFAADLSRSSQSLKSLLHALINHFRHIACIHALGDQAKALVDEPLEVFEAYKKSAAIYPPKTALEIIDFLIDSSQRLALTISEQVMLEMILIKIISTGALHIAPAPAAEQTAKPSARDETLIRFAAVELEGRVKQLNNQDKN